MAVSYISSTSQEATSITTMPTHAAGDILLVFAFRDGSTTAPTVPAGWASLTSATATSTSGVLAYKVAASGSETSGTWTNATLLVCNVYRNAQIAAATSAGAASATITWPALTLKNSDGTSWVAGFAGHRSINGSLATAPTGMTNRQALEGATADGGSHDTNGGVSSWSSTTTAYGGTSSGYVAAEVELVPADDRVAFNAVTSTTSGAASGDPTPGTMSWTHDAGSQTKRAVIVAVEVVSSSTGDNTTHTRSLTYGGTACTFLGKIFTNNNTAGQDGLNPMWIELWGLQLSDGTLTGSQTVSWSISKAGNTYGLVGVALSYFNVDTIGTVSTGFGTEAGTAKSQVVSSAVLEMVVQSFLMWGSSGSITAYSQNSRSSTAGASWLGPFIVGDAFGAASITFNGTIPTTGNDYCDIAVRLAPAAATVSRTAALAGSGALTATATAKYARSVALTGAGTLAATARAKFATTAALTGHGALAATATAKFSRPAALTGSGVLSATAAATKFTLPALLAGSGTLTATRFAKFARTVGLAGAGTLSAAAAAAQFTLGAFLAGAGALSATASAKYARTVALSGSGTLSATVLAKHQRAATLTGTGTLAATADGTGTPERAAPLTGHGALAAATYAKLSVTAALSGQGALTAAAYAKLSRNAALTGAGTLSATARAKFSITATLAGVGTLTATGNVAGAPERAATLIGTGTLFATAHAAPSTPTVRRFIVTRTGRIVMLGARPIVQGLTV